MALQPAHRGYEYQDLIAALRLVDVLLGQVTEVFVDHKFFDGDRFDDLTWTDTNNVRQRMQVKHRDNDDLPLPIGTFRTTTRGLRLDDLVRSAQNDIEGFGGATQVSYRILMRDAEPTDSSLLDVLRDPESDPGPFMRGMVTKRYQFDADALLGVASTNEHWSFIEAIDRDDLVSLCSRTIVEVAAPPASFDLTAPGPAELLLLDRVRTEIGAESYPNSHRSAEDVSAALINTARGARIGVASISIEELIRRSRLRSDFGAVARAHPVEPALEINRSEAREQLVRAAETAAREGAPLIVTGPPGQGKSWTCQRVVSDLEEEGWLVADHFCFLGDADEEREARVLSESIIGSLLMRLAEKDPSLVAAQRPRFAADEKALIEALVAAREKHQEKRIALVVDGLDHVSRVQGHVPGQPTPSMLVSQDLANLDLPTECTMMILSQPGDHLQPFEIPDAQLIELPSFGAPELSELAHRLHVIAERPDAPIQLSDTETSALFLQALEERSAGNPLYATYLCREIARDSSTALSPDERVNDLPAFDGTLEAYYTHLLAGIDEGIWVAEIIALLDFAISRSELKQMRPELGHAVDVALDRLAPVVVEKSQQGGVRVYHESFARFLIGRFDAHPDAMKATLDRVVTWLEDRGFLEDSRSFRYLLPTLARAGEHERVIAMVARDFASLSVAAGFAPSAIVANLAVAIRSASVISNWPAVVRFVELSRAAESFEFERLDDTAVDFLDVAMEVLGASTVAERLLHDGKTTVPARAGIQLCAEIDRHGGVAPWLEYMTAFRHEDAEDNTSYGEESDRQVQLAWCRGRLRLVANAMHMPSNSPANDLLSTLDEDRLREWINSSEPDSAEIADIFLGTFGPQKTVGFLTSLENPGPYLLSLATTLEDQPTVDPEDEETESVSPRFLAVSAFAHGVPDGALADVIHLGAQVTDVAIRSIQEDRERLLDLTHAVLNHRIQFETEPIFSWLDACKLAAYRDPFGLATAEGLLDGEGWYRCWLRFCIGLVRAESLSAEQSTAALDAIRELGQDVRPFVGDPRACDLYNLHSVISRTLQRSVALISDEHWSEALRVLLTVSDETGTTLFGEVGGPLSPHFLLRLIADETTDTRFSASRQIVDSVLSRWAGGKYYSDVAAFHLAAARFAVASRQSTSAKEHWDSASQMLVAYGWRKDITIWELLNSLDVLIEKETTKSRQRLEVLQPLTERVIFHTDGRDTRSADDRWWRLLAQADPLALATLVVPHLMRKTNIPDEELGGALRALWTFNHEAVDPILAGALRLSLDITLHNDDERALNRLLDARPPLAPQMFRLLLARLDERPIRYSTSDSDEILSRENLQIESINSLAQQAGAPAVQVEEVKSPPTPHGPLGGRVNHDQRTLIEVIERDVVPDWGTGAVGLGRAVRAWRRRSYRSSSPSRSTSWYANAIGYRLLDAIADERVADAEAAIWAIAEGVRYGDDASILVRIAEGLEAHGQSRLAALSHALAWTRTRGGGGWLNFGGEDQVESLRRAADLDPKGAWSVIATEVETLVRGRRYGTYGVSQALIYAAAGVHWDQEVLPQGEIETAFKMWDEAAEVIEWRLPRVDQRDDPELPYTVGPSFGSELAIDKLHEALASAVFGGLAHPSRERKRRSLLAFQLLLRTDPSWISPGTSVALSELSDPTTLTWLLAVLLRENLNEGLGPALTDQLRNRANSSWLTVRALARSLLESANVEVDGPPVTDPHPRLLQSESSQLWVPDSEEESDLQNETAESPPSAEERAETILRTMARRRLVQAEQILPGVSEAVRSQLAVELESPDYQSRLNRQIEALSDRAEPHWPDAFTAPNETAERVLQEVSGGGRSTLAAQGEIVVNPSEWELRLAKCILNSPHLPLQLEFARIPRPSFALPPDTSDALWSEVAAAATGNATQANLLGASHEDRWFSATVRVQDCTEVPRVLDGSYEGWYVIGWSERREIPSSRLSRTPTEPSRTFVKSAIELRQDSDDVALEVDPFAEGDVRDWKARVELAPGASSYGSAPLIGSDSDGPAISDTENGLGRGLSPLVPTQFLIALLGLDPHEAPFRMDHGGGAALLMETWRSRYHGGDYELARPLLIGCRLILRPDLFDQLQADTQGLCTWREFIYGWLNPTEESQR